MSVFTLGKNFFDVFRCYLPRLIALEMDQVRD